MAAYTDLIMCLGVLAICLAFPAAVGSFSRGAPPRGAILSLVLGGSMIVYANASRPGGYSAEELPGLFMRVFSGA